MPRLVRNQARATSAETVHFCAVPRTGARSIIKAFENSGWGAEYEILANLGRYFNHFELRAHYGGNMPRTFAIVRHPMRRLESAFSVHGDHPNWFDQFMEMPSQEIYTTFERAIRPATDFVLEKTEIFKYENGLSSVLNELTFRGWIKNKAHMPHLGRGKYDPIDWRRAPEYVIDKVLQIYAQDFYYFEYSTFPDDCLP